MPRPPKPPMTLKEAKKAYKKEGIGIQYTASQMERADRFDDREEKRKKELERERQRVDNKRKRDQKEARERAARQKMLEEGRITVEDTWGKVTASQPRLNKFFGQKAIVPSKRNIQEVTVENKETSRNLQEDNGHAQDKINTSEHSIHGPTSPEMESLKRKSSIATSNSCGTTPFKSVPSSQQSRHHGQQREVHNGHSVPPALTELEPTRLNIPSAGSRKLVYDKRPWKAHDAKPLTTRRILEPENNEPERRSPVPNTMHINDGASTYSHDELEHNQNDHSMPADPVSEDQDLTECPLRTASEFDKEEDFTDGIDDETLLELYDHQARKDATPKDLPSADLDSPSSTVKLRSPGSGREDHHSGTETKEVQQKLPESNSLSDSFTSCFNEIDEDDLIALAEEVEAEMSTPSASATKTGETRGKIPQSTNLKSSLGRKKQGYQDSPCYVDLAKPKPGPPPRSQHTETSLYPSGLGPPTNTGKDASRYKSNASSSRREPQKLNTTMAPPPPPPPPPVRRHAKEMKPAVSSIPINRPTQSVRRPRLSHQQRKERVLPWNQPSKQHYYHTNPTNNTNPSNNDDFDVLGPSTQALMVELAEQAEAKISTSRE